MADQLVVIQVGQAGVQVGEECWKRLASEHGIGEDGRLKENEREESSSGGRRCFFNEVASGGFTSRGYWIDTEETPIDQVLNGSHRSLFSKKNVVKGEECAANNFCRGHYTIGKNILDTANDGIRNLAESCSKLRGFLLLRSINGGTGSGLASNLLEELKVNFGKKEIFAVTVVPSRRYSSCVVEPYNVIHSVHYMTEFEDCSILVDNESMYSICENSLGISSPRYSDTNRLLAHLVSSLTTPLRLGNTFDLTSIRKCVCPYPCAAFITPSLSPMFPHSKTPTNSLNLDQITSHSFSKTARLLSIQNSTPSNPHSKILSSLLMYRGDIVPTEINRSISSFYNKNNSMTQKSSKKKKMKKKKSNMFVSWNPSPVKCTLTQNQKFSEKNKPKELMNLTNSTGIASVFRRLARRFDLLYRKRAFVHWYVGEGMSEGIFSEAREETAILLRDMKHLSGDSLPFDDEE